LCAFLLSALSAAVPLAGSIPVALALISLVLFGNQWVAATYIATVGDTFPSHVAGRVNGLAGFGDSGATLIAVLPPAFVDHFSYTPVFIAAGNTAAACHGQRLFRAAKDRTRTDRCLILRDAPDLSWPVDIIAVEYP
jgi:hypothetical protein